MYIFPQNIIPQYPLTIDQEYKTLKTDLGDARENRRQMWTFPKRTISLKFQALRQADIDTLWNFFCTTKGSFYPFFLFDPTKDSTGAHHSHVGEYVAQGDGTTTVFDLPSASTTGLTVYENGVFVAGYTFSSGTGTGGADRITFTLGGAITSSSAANPTVITTTAAHGLTTGHSVTISGHSAAAVNGTWSVTTISTTTFSIPVSVATGGTGGTFVFPGDAGLITASYTGQQRYRVRFTEDKMSKELFMWVLYNLGLSMTEVLA